MNIATTTKVVFNGIRKASPWILSGLSMLGVGITTYFGIKDSKKAEPIQEKIQKLKKEENNISVKERRKLNIDLAWSYRRTALSGLVTIGCIAGSTTISWIRLKNATDALIVTEKLFEKYKKAVLATGASSIAIGEEMAKDSQNEIPERVPEEDDDNKLLIYDANNGHWFRAREADVYKAVIHVNDLLVDRGTASVKDFYKILKCDPPAGSNIRGWYTWSDEWFNKHEGKVTLNFEMSAGYKTEDGLYYAIFCFYDDPMYHTELGASMDQCLEERRTLFHMSEAELDEYRNHE